ncbi:MAG TPA: GNAT family N-acetyltransferase [Acidimicrobiales bacterium]|nr:GNAT family N-acetyltransferase [Acidimicrobiales bacterium]
MGVSWDEPTRLAFFDQQFDAQAADYRRRFPESRTLVVERSGAAVGRLYLAEDDTTLHVLDVALLPEHRGHGIGGALLQWIIGHGKRVSLSVGKWNPAQRLYARLGFEVVADDGAYLAMERLPLS